MPLRDKLVGQTENWRVVELAKTLRCSPSYLYQCISIKALRPGRIGKDYRIPPEEALRFAKENGFLQN